jgi:hypothetical protein
LQTSSPSRLHPVFESLTRAVFEAPTVIRNVQLNAYIKALRLHDWSFEFADDHQAWLRGNEQRKQLELMARDLDPDFAIWNVNAPAAYRRGA